METKKNSKTFLKPRALIEEIGPLVNSLVADFGSGSGALTIELAKAIGSGGLVTAIDVVPQALESVRSLGKTAGLRNIKTIQADLELPGASTLKDESQDLVLLANILFQSERQSEIIKEAKRVLKPGGRLAVVDWKPGESQFGPLAKNRLEPEGIRLMVGLEVLKELGSTGSYHFGFLFKK